LIDSGQLTVVELAKDALWSILTRADKMLALVLVLTVAGLVFHGRYGAEIGGLLLVESVGADLATHALKDYGILRITGPLGESQIEIGPKGARIVSAPCMHKLCMRRGWIVHQGAQAICVPNGLVLRIAGLAPVDAVLR